jgi:magnesium transporter
MAVKSRYHREGWQAIQSPSLIKEDIVTSGRDRRSKIWRYSFIVLKMLYFANGEKRSGLGTGKLHTGEQLPHHIPGKEGDVFNVIRERLRTSKGRIRSWELTT